MMLNIFPGERDWAIQTERLIAQAAYRGSDIFECDRAAKRIKEGDFESFHNEWHELGRETEEAGRKALEAGDIETAKYRLYRASNYYRHADFFLLGTDERKIANFRKTKRCFEDAIKYDANRVEAVQVTCGDDIYDGYYVFPNKGREKSPAVLMLGGADSLAEEIFFWGTQELADRGIGVLILDTPGRGSSLRLRHIHSRPDYEVPVKAAIDYLEARPDVDPDRIGCVGVSMAGYYAPRGTAFEPRIKALVLWCACYDILEELYNFYPPIQKQIQWILGVDNDTQAREKLKDFNMKGIAHQIRCPTLISHGAGDVVMDVKGARRLYDEIGSTDKVLKIWEGDEGGAVHCNYDNWSISIPFMFDWLAKRL
ncbi:alpha/beta hydrolase [Chelatococcus sp. HY11]|nr:alpha/beta hydrolase [Chelatococcus sp. HY11]